MLVPFSLPSFSRRAIYSRGDCRPAVDKMERQFMPQQHVDAFAVMACLVAEKTRL